MKDQYKTKAQLIKEVEALRQQVADLPAAASEPQQLEETLHQSEARHRGLFENANDAIISVSLDGTITAVNRGLEVMTGWSREELIGRHYRVIATPHLVTLEEERTRRALAGEKLPSVYEAEVRRKDGSVMPVEEKSHFIRDREGKPIDDPKNNEQRPTSYKLLCFPLEVDLIMWWSSLIPRNIE